MREPVDEQADVDKTRAQTFSEKSETYDTQGGLAGAMAAVPTFGPPVEPGEVGVLGPYRIIRQLGQGGMGAVYAAIDTRLDRKIALKVMLPSYAAIPSAKERFLREARAAAKVSHDNVVTVHEADDRNGVPYIAMQYLEGYPLDEYLKKKGEIDLPQILRIARETAAGLEAAHKLGLIHRDIKPGNLWLEAPNGRVKLLDFGLARPVDSDVELTKSGVVVGTPAYMSPEQAQGERVDARSDLFSLGVMLYRLATGQLPFQGNTTMAVLMALGTKDPVPVRTLKPELPEGFARLVHDLLSKDPAGRPQSATEVIRRLRDLNRNPNSLPVVSMPQVSMIDSAPAPSYVPIPIGLASMANPFEDIDITDSVTEEPKPKAQPKAEKPANRKPFLIGGALAGLLLLVVGIVVLSGNKNKPETKVDPPVGPGKTTTLPTVKPKDSPKSVATTDPDRKVAEWVLAIGGKLWLEGNVDQTSNIADLPKGRFVLTNLYLGGTTVTDEDLVRFKELQGKVALFLENTKVSDAGLAHLKNLKELVGLHLAGTAVTDGGLIHLKEFGSLQWLDLSGTTVSDAGLAHLKNLGKLGAITLGNLPVGDEGLSHLKELKGLESLTASGTAVTDAGLIHLKEIKGLRNLYLKGTKVSAKGLADFHVALPACRIEHDGGVIEAEDVDRRAAEWVLSIGGKIQVNGVNKQIKALAELPKERFTLSYVDLYTIKQATDEGMANLKDLTGVIKLEIGHTAVTDAGMVHFKNYRKLTRLILNGTKVTDAGLVNFKDCKELTGIFLLYLPITDTGLSNFKDCTGLKELTLSRANLTIAGYEQIGNFSALESLEISGLQPTKAQLAPLKRLKSLKRLNLKANTIAKSDLDELHAAMPGCTIEHDGGVIEPVDVDRRTAEWVLSKGGKVRIRIVGFEKEIPTLAELPKERFSVVHVNFTYCKEITDADLARLKPLSELSYVTLYGTNVSDLGLLELKEIKTLTYLRLGRTKVTDTGLIHLRELPKLKALTLNENLVTDVGLDHLKSVTTLRELGVVRTQMTKSALENFQMAIPGCKIVHDGGVIEAVDVDRKAAEWVLGIGGKVQVNGLSPEIANVRELPKEAFQLTGFNLELNSKVTDAGLANLKDCKDLTMIGLYQTPVSDAGLAHFKDCKRVKVLSLGGTKVTNTGLALFKDCKDLTWLGLFNTPITDDGVAPFKDCKNIKILDLNTTKITDAGLAYFKDCKNLTTLYLNNLKITDAGLAYFKDCQNLTGLFLDNTPVSNDGIGFFKDHRGLTQLGLNKTKISEEGLAAFQECKGLTYLGLQKTTIGLKAIQEFRAAVPGCRIEHDGGVIEPKK
ncbi:MAG: protein kinase [Gemmataceae bacterium]|nr:protein kinase [Gemmataceae bacterium]